MYEKIKSIEIIDNGDGFNDKNQQAFNKLNTDNKKEQGCKGFGRIYYKKAFNIVEICSFNSDKNNETVNFVFTDEEFINDNIKLHKHTNADKQTSLLLEDIITDNLSNEDNEFYDKNVFYKKIYNFIAPYIFLQHNKKITIKFYLNDNEEKDSDNHQLVINLDCIEEIAHQEISIKKSNSTFFDSEQILNLWYKITKREFEKDKATITTAICCKNRPCFESSFDKKPLQIDINIIGYDVLFLLESQ